MSGSYRLKRSFSKFDQNVTKDVQQVPGDLGILKGGKYLVEVPNRPGYYYVRLRGDLNELAIARNDSIVAPFYDLPVIVSRRKYDPTQWYIVGRDAGRYQNWGSINYLPNHGPQHSFEPNNPGYDITWVYGDQFMPMLGSPSGSSGSMSLTLYPAFYYINGELKYMGYTGTPDLTAYRPASGSNLARMILVYGDDDGNPGISVGETFASSITGSREIIQYIPAISGSGIPAWAVRLDWDTNTLDWENRFDVRPILVAPTFSGSAGGSSTPTSYTPKKVLYTNSSGTATVDNIFSYEKIANNQKKPNFNIGGHGKDPNQTGYNFSTVRDPTPISGSSQWPIGIFSYGGAPGYIDFYAARGTEYARSAMQANDRVMTIDMYAFFGSGSSQNNVVGEHCLTLLENQLTNAVGAEFQWFVGMTGTSDLPEALSLGAGYAKFAGLVQVPNDDGYYWGNYYSTNTWRFASSGTSLDIAQRQADASWKSSVHITSSGTSFGDVLGGNTVSIEPDGFLRLLGDATVFDDLQIPGLSVETTGVNDPPLKTFIGNLQAHAFEATEVVGNEQQVFFEIQMSHRWKLGSSIYPHVHFAPSTSPPSGSVVRWGFEYAWANINDPFPTGTTTIYVDAWAGTDLRGHKIGMFDPIVATDKTLSSLLMCRLFRNSSHASDNYAGDAYFLSVDLHTEIDSMGSKQEYIK